MSPAYCHTVRLHCMRPVRSGKWGQHFCRAGASTTLVLGGSCAAAVQVVLGRWWEGAKIELDACGQEVCRFCAGAHSSLVPGSNTHLCQHYCGRVILGMSTQRATHHSLTPTLQQLTTHLMGTGHAGHSLDSCCSPQPEQHPAWLCVVDCLQMYLLLAVHASPFSVRSLVPAADHNTTIPRLPRRTNRSLQR
jgi:hypothetical protein